MLESKTQEGWGTHALEGSSQKLFNAFPGNLRSTVKVAVIAVGAMMLVVEVTQARKNWYEGNVQIENERLVRTQQEREAAEVQVALSAAKKNLQEEMKAIADREAVVMAAIKHVQEGWGSPLAQAASANMDRYRAAYSEAKDRALECARTKLCTEVQAYRLTAEQSLYRLLFYSARGSLYQAMDRTADRVRVPKSEEIE